MHIQCENSLSVIICGGGGFENGIETKLSSGLFAGSFVFYGLFPKNFGHLGRAYKTRMNKHFISTTIL